MLSILAYFETADALREAASDLGLQPRQLQSITWETKRKLFDVSTARRASIDAAWRNYYSNPGVTLEATQQRILEITKGN